MFEKLGNLIDGAIAHAESEGFYLADSPDEAFSSIIFGGLAYGEKRHLTVEIKRKDGKGTKKALQVAIERFGLEDGPYRMGRYEGVFYIL